MRVTGAMGFYFLQALALACNGSENLCLKQVDQVVFPTAHNAMASEQDGFIPPDQIFGLKRQLSDGIRGFAIDVHTYKNTLYLCHAYCTIGKVPFFDWLWELKLFLITHPTEVVILKLESYVSPPETVSIIQQAGLLPYLHTQNPSLPWPTLKKMTQDNRRLIIFSDLVSPEAPSWYHSSEKFIKSTSWNVQKIEQLNCDLSNSNSTFPLYGMYHLREDPYSIRANSIEMNHNPFLIDRVKRCQAAWKHVPNFIEVLFYSDSDLFKAAKAVNTF